MESITKEILQMTKQTVRELSITMMEQFLKGHFEMTKFLMATVWKLTQTALSLKADS